VSAIDGAFEQAADDPEVRVIVLRGEGPTFSAGHDLGSPDTLATRAEREHEPMGRRYGRTRAMDVEPHLRWRAIPKPTIAMVHGACIYAAWMLASAMDVIFASEDAQFLPTNFAYFSVPWDVGARRAKYLMYDNRFIGAREAMDWGFVAEVHPLDQLEAATMAYAERVAQQDPFQLRMMKHSIHQMQEIQGFTAHIMSSYSDRMVRAANTEVPISEQPAEGGRRKYISVERARAHRDAGGEGA
jgi:enoyl-CoA hydratase